MAYILLLSRFGEQFEYPLLIQSVLMNMAMFALIHECVRILNKESLVKGQDRMFTGTTVRQITTTKHCNPSRMQAKKTEEISPALFFSFSVFPHHQTQTINVVRYYCISLLSSSPAHFPPFSSSSSSTSSSSSSIPIPSAIVVFLVFLVVCIQPIQQQPLRRAPRQSTSTPVNNKEGIIKNPNKYYLPSRSHTHSANVGLADGPRHAFEKKVETPGPLFCQHFSSRFVSVVVGMARKLIPSHASSPSFVTLSSSSLLK